MSRKEPLYINKILSLPGIEGNFGTTEYDADRKSWCDSTILIWGVSGDDIM
jgi:hypothetical protein